MFVQLAEWIKPSHLQKSAVLLARAVLDYWQFTTFTLRSCFLTKTALRQVVHRDVSRLLAQPSHLQKSAVLLTRTEQVCGLPFCLAYTSQMATPPPSARSRCLGLLAVHNLYAPLLFSYENSASSGCSQGRV